MISESEIRKYTEALKYSMKRQRECGCDHCLALQEDLKFQLDVLSWVLGDQYEFARYVEDFFKRVADDKSQHGIKRTK